MLLSTHPSAQEREGISSPAPPRNTIPLSYSHPPPSRELAEGFLLKKPRGWVSLVWEAGRVKVGEAGRQMPGS